FESVIRLQAGRSLGQNALDYLPMHIRQSAIDAIMVISKALVVDAKQVQHRGVEIVPGSRLVDGLPANLIGAAVGDTVFEAGARHPYGKPILIVIAAFANDIFRRLREGRAAELGREQYERVIEHAALA